MNKLNCVLAILLAVLGLSLTVAAQGNNETLEPGMAMYISRFPTGLRAEPNNSSQRLITVEPGSIVTIIEVQERWAKVTYEDQEGWLMVTGLANVTEDDIVNPDDPLPLPTGPYQVGQTYRYWVDESREETYTQDDNDHRELLVTIWYPADVPEGAERAHYWEFLFGPSSDELLAVLRRQPVTADLDRIIELNTHAYLDVPVADAESSYPVLIFSHGYSGWPETYAAQTLELASHGYIVVGINHTFFSGTTVFPDGRVIAGISNAAAGFQEALTTGGEDVSFVINQLELINTTASGDILSGKLDLGRIGMFGHSYGGEMSVKAASMEDRLLAIVNQDGTLLAGTLPEIQQPFLLMSAGAARYPSAGPNYTARVTAFEHCSFCDAVLFYPGMSRVLPLRSIDITRAYVLAFFDEYLKGIEQPLLDGPSEDFPEVDFRVNTPG